MCVLRYDGKLCTACSRHCAKARGNKLQNTVRLNQIDTLTFRRRLLLKTLTVPTNGVQGVQLLLDGVVDYLPNPLEVPNYALDTAKDEEKVRTYRI